MHASQTRVTTVEHAGLPGCTATPAVVDMGTMVRDVKVITTHSVNNSCAIWRVGGGGVHGRWNSLSGDEYNIRLYLIGTLCHNYLLITCYDWLNWYVFSFSSFFGLHV